MKKSVYILIFFSFTFLAFGQYKQNKLNYNFREYQFQHGDRYNPTVAGIASFLIPGLGQVTSGETGRGITFFAGYVASYAILYSSSLKVLNYLEENPNYVAGDSVDGAGGLMFGLLSYLTTTIWATVDAVRVAKVNNLAFRDQSNKSNISFSPILIDTGNYKKLAGGIGIKIDLN